MDAHQLVDVVLGLGGIAATLGSVVMGLRASRRDALEQEVKTNSRDITHIQSHLTDKTGYRPLAR